MRRINAAALDGVGDPFNWTVTISSCAIDDADGHCPAAIGRWPDCFSGADGQMDRDTMSFWMKTFFDENKAINPEMIISKKSW